MVFKDIRNEKKRFITNFRNNHYRRKVTLFTNFRNITYFRNFCYENYVLRIYDITKHRNKTIKYNSL